MKATGPQAFTELMLVTKATDGAWVPFCRMELVDADQLSNSRNLIEVPFSCYLKLGKCVTKFKAHEKCFENKPEL